MTVKPTYALHALRDLERDLIGVRARRKPNSRYFFGHLLKILIREREEPPMMEAVAQCPSCKRWISTGGGTAPLTHNCPAFPAPRPPSGIPPGPNQMARDFGRIEDKLDWLIAQFMKPIPGAENRGAPVQALTVPAELRHIWLPGMVVFLGGQRYVVKEDWAMTPEPE